MGSNPTKSGLNCTFSVLKNFHKNSAKNRIRKYFVPPNLHSIHLHIHLHNSSNPARPPQTQPKPIIKFNHLIRLVFDHSPSGGCFCAVRLHLCCVWVPSVYPPSSCTAQNFPLYITKLFCIAKTFLFAGGKVERKGVEVMRGML